MNAILAIDTATGPCSVAIWKEGAIIGYDEDMRTVTQSVSLMPMIEKLLETTRTRYSELTAVAATVGPGSFTGIRVGLAAARGICFSAGIPGIGLTTLDVLAFAAAKKVPQAKEVLAILNAGKGEWYHQRYSLPDCRSQGELGLGLPEIALADAPALIVGNHPAANAGITFPRADALAELAAQRGEGQPLVPFYLRGPDAKLPAAAGV